MKALLQKVLCALGLHDTKEEVLSAPNAYAVECIKTCSRCPAKWFVVHHLYNGTRQERIPG